jgi:NitT/TauT family transport system permease protein
MSDQIQILERKGMRKSIFTKLLFILFGICAWELVARYVLGARSTLIPPMSKILVAMVRGLLDGELTEHTLFSLYLIITGIGIGLILAFFLTALYMISKRVADVLDVFIAVMHPLPGIALLPIVMLLVGLGAKAIIVIIIHSIIWPVIVNAVAGFKSVPKIQLELGRNIGMNEFRLIYSVMIPNAFPHILAGLKIAWSRSWRALVAAEMVFGASGIIGGLGWYIYKKRYFMDIPQVFAGLLVIVIIGFLVDELVFGKIEKNTVIKWRMSI